MDLLQVTEPMDLLPDNSLTVPGWSLMSEPERPPIGRTKILHVGVSAEGIDHEFFSVLCTLKGA